MVMKLMQLRIRNFMGCKELDIDFDGRNMRVFGDNATGKTTLSHAFNWLLFDKNAFGKTEFGIKPYDSNGDVIHRLEISVEAMFEIDGNPKQLKKVLREKWTRRRGSAEETYSGNETEYYVNTVPKKKKEFTEEIARIIDESLFRMITNPLFFNETIKWQDRRKMLLDVCGDISDEDVIDRYRELAPLLELLKGRTVEELKSIVSSDMKDINKALGVLPSRIAEADMAKPTLSGDIDVSALEGLEEERKALAIKEVSILNGAGITEAKVKLSVLRRELAGLNVNPDIQKEQEEVQAIKRWFDESARTIKNHKEAIARIDFDIRMNGEKKKQLSGEWDEVFKEAFVGNICPTCKQEFPPEQLEEKKKKFNLDKSAKLDFIEHSLSAVKMRDNELVMNKSQYKKEITDLDALAVEKNERLKELSAIITSKTAEAKAAHEQKREELSKAIHDTENYITEQELNAEDMVKGVEQEIRAIDEKIAPIKQHLASVEMIKRQDARIEELKSQQQTLSRSYTDLERQLFLTEEFTRKKVALLDEKINQNFKYARFKLFDVQVNGGIVETCEVTYKGIPYGDLNTAGRINIGLDIINTLSATHGVSAPIFIDNMESVTKPIDTTSQRIDLIVSEADKTLRFEKENSVWN